MDQTTAPQEQPEQILLTWNAPDRPFKKRGIRFYFNIAVIAILICLILLFFYQYILIAVVFSILFVGVVSATVPPRDITYQISTTQLKIGDGSYLFDQLESFWQTEMLGHTVLIVTTKLKFPKQLIMMVETEKLDATTQLLSKYVTQSTPPKQTWIDRRASDLVKIVNLGVK